MAFRHISTTIDAMLNADVLHADREPSLDGKREALVIDGIDLSDFEHLFIPVPEFDDLYSN